METQDRTYTNYKVWLCEELSERARKNPSYSLNSFSRSLGISAPSLSQIMSGKRPLTRKTALKIIEKCGLTGEPAKHFLSSALGVSWSSSQGDTLCEKKPFFREMTVDHFRLIADWHHFAILNLAEVKPNESHPSWLAERLHLPERLVEEAFDRLVRMKMIKRRGKGFYRCSQNTLIRYQPNTIAMRRHLLQFLEKAVEELRREKMRMELFSTMTMAVNETKLVEARELILEFRKKLCALVETGKRDRVYTLAVQLFPLSH